MMEHEYWVKGGVSNHIHMSTHTDKAMNSIMNRLYGVIASRVWIWYPFFITESRIVLFLCHYIIKTGANAYSIAVKLIVGNGILRISIIILCCRVPHSLRKYVKLFKLSFDLRFVDRGHLRVDLEDLRAPADCTNMRIAGC